MVTRMPFLGKRKLDASIALRNASCTVSPKHATSPVDAISTPVTGSAPRSRVKENMGALMPTYLVGRSGPYNAGSRSLDTSNPSITLVAAATKSAPTVLDTNGKERLARRLHSMMDTSPPLASSCMLNGPVIFSATATLAAIVFTASM